MKTYTKPEVQIVLLNVENIIAASGGLTVDSEGNVSGKLQGVGASGAAMSRGQNGGFGGGLWEDMK